MPNSVNTNKQMKKYYDTFIAKLPKLLKEHSGEYTVFMGRKPLGFWKTFDDAYSAGLKEYGNVPMLIMEVSDEYSKPVPNKKTIQYFNAFLARA